MLQSSRCGYCQCILEDKFIIPLDFEILDSVMPYYQAGIGNRLCYEITFNDHNRVILSTGTKLDASYEISDIFLEYEIVNHSNLTKHISEECQNVAFLYGRVLKHRQIRVDKSDVI